MSSNHMHCVGIWDLIKVCWEQKQEIEDLRHKVEIFLLKMSTLLRSEPETAACKATWTDISSICLENIKLFVSFENYDPY